MSGKTKIGVLRARARKRRVDTRTLEDIKGIPQQADIMSSMVACGIQLPEECVAVELHASADSLMQVVYTCNVTGELAHKLGRALQVQAVKDRLR